MRRKGSEHTPIRIGGQFIHITHRIIYIKGILDWLRLWRAYPSPHGRIEQAWAAVASKLARVKKRARWQVAAGPIAAAGTCFR